MKRVNTFSVIFVSILAVKSAVCEVVETIEGRVNGTILRSWTGVEFHAFRNIPFAEAPTGDLRFRAPVPKKPWSGVHDATKYGNMCIQYDDRIEESMYNFDEDCLQLNVYTKEIRPVTLKPVIVFIHGGSYEMGSALNHGPLYLMDRELVLVTVNYRVGPFGFLATGTKEAAGNMGLKDQVVALRWVQRNIEKFGGDPKRVTISGLSAGGYSVTSHMASEMSQGLFNGVIAMSGSQAQQGKMNTEYLDFAKKIAGELECPVNNVEDMMKCLREVPAEKFNTIQYRKFLDCAYGSAWVPVIEADDFGEERFFTRNPIETYKDAENLSKVPLMIGVTQDEMVYLAPIILSDEHFLRQLSEEFNSIIPECFYFDEKHTSDLSRLRDLYFPFNEIDNRSFSGLANLFSDGNIGYGVHRIVHLLSSSNDIFYYKISYVGQHSVFKYPRNKPFGVTHADDLQYVLDTPYVGPPISPSDIDSVMVERMTRIWEQFARTGDPNNSTSEYLTEMVWPKFDTKNEYYLDIGTHLIEKHGLNLERFIVWDRVISGAAQLKFAYFTVIVALLTLLKLT